MLTKALYYLVALIVFFIPYTLIASFFGGVLFEVQFKAEVYLLISGLALFFIDMFLQTFLVQRFIFKLLYLILTASLVGLAYNFIVPSYVMLLNGREDLVWKVVTITQIYVLLYLVYLSFKRFIVIVWGLYLV